VAVLTAKGISAVAVELLTRTLVLPMTATRIPGEEFAGSNGDTITVRVPQPGTARTKAAPGDSIVYDDVTEVPVDVQVKHLYHAKLVSDEELSMQLENFARQITRVQVGAVATLAEDQMATAMNGLASELQFALDGSNVDAIVLEAREMLGRASAPLDNRFLAVSPEVATFILAQDNVTRVDASGSNSALANAIIARYRGFTVVESNGLTAGHAVAYHRSGFAFANRVPVTPRGVTSSATTQAGGVGLRQIFQYVPDKLSDASVVSTFAGAAAVTDTAGATPRFVKITTSAV
jgi:P22 coat protein - gene protein 5.